VTQPRLPLLQTGHRHKFGAADLVSDPASGGGLLRWMVVREGNRSERRR